MRGRKVREFRSAKSELRDLREFEDVGELLKVLNSIDGMVGNKGKDCEVLVNGDGLKSSSSKDEGEDGINELIRMIKTSRRVYEQLGQL